MGTQLPTHFSMTGEFSDGVWLEKAMFSFCRKMEETTSREACCSSEVLNGVSQRAPGQNSVVLPGRGLPETSPFCQFL